MGKIKGGTGGRVGWGVGVMRRGEGCCQGWGKTNGGADPGGSGCAAAANKSDVIGQVGPGMGF